MIQNYPELTLDERRHIYKLNGFQIPSVTTVMKPLSDSFYGGIDETTLANAAKRGTAVHNAIENWVKYDISDAPPEHRGYFEAFLLWNENRKPLIKATEARVYHKTLRYAGTVDMACLVMDDVLTCVDFKTSSQIVEMLVRVQLEAYMRAFASHGVRFETKQVVHLQKDGNYSVKAFYGHDNEAWETFCGLLTVHNYLAKNRG
jgi:hypothetical protein